MRVIKGLREMRAFARKAQCRGKTIGFVPTMGCLHEGHLSLVEAACAGCDLAVVSIFVNPLQFGANEDLARYPRDLRHDKKMLRNYDLDVLFLPSARDLYHPDRSTLVEVGGLSKKLCGISRPKHFAGVATIVAKLLNIVRPDRAYFGEKDHQQLLIIKRMVRDLDLPVEVIGLPTVREFDGLAMSSRNQYLSAKERHQAAILYQALNLARDQVNKGERDKYRLTLRMRSLIGTIPSVRLDYLAVVDPETLEEKKELKGRLLFAVAAYLGRTRLIDNILLDAS